MPKVNIVADTDSGDLSVSINGQIIPDVKYVSACWSGDYYDSEQKLCFTIETGKESGDGVSERTTIFADEMKVVKSNLVSAAFAKFFDSEGK